MAQEVEMTSEQCKANYRFGVALSRIFPKDYETEAQPLVDAITDPVVRACAQSQVDNGITAREEARALSAREAEAMRLRSK